MASSHVVLKYIVKHSSKTERRSESYHEMLIRVVVGSGSEAPALSAYRSFLVETLVEHDVGGQEMCHLLLRLPLVVCSHTFFSKC